MNKASDVKKELIKLADPLKAADLARFFKTGKGQYGEGDIFIGIKVPDQRAVAKKFPGITLNEIKKILRDPIHECRFTALLILIEKYNSADTEKREEIFKFYLDNTAWINNWDLVDLSSEKILGR